MPVTLVEVEALDLYQETIYALPLTRPNSRNHLKEHRNMTSAKPQISFGTDGWRGIIADNFTGANVRLVSQAVVNYFLRPEVPGEPTLFIGYDNRSQSEYFAAEAAKVVAASGLKAVLSAQSCSSPSISYNAHKDNAKGGIMITASHNPPQFNGLKIKVGYGGSALPS